MANIGIDFGTSYSTVAYKNPRTGNAEAIRINGSEKIPTMLYFSPEGGEPMVGQEAFEMYETCLGIEDEEEIALHLSGIFSQLKRYMNETEKLYLPDGREFSYVDMISKFFSFIKKEVENTAFLGETVTDVCITHPVEFSTEKKEILVKAAKKSGFTKIKLLLEPVAASMGFSDSISCNNEGILIYDFGGGTFDLAFVKFNEGGDHVTLPPVGDANCGGENIDRILYDAWDKEILYQSGRHISGLEDSVDYPFIKAVCMKHKEFLSRQFAKMNTWTLSAFVKGKNYKLPMTKDGWNNMISPIIDKTILLTKQMLRSIEDEKFKLDKVILIGGSSQIPLVSEELSKILPIAPQKVADSDIAVAKGAALFINEDEVPVHDCYCRMDGKKLTTKIKVCPYCGTANIRYNYKYADEEVVKSAMDSSSVHKGSSPIQKCFCNNCGNEINTSMRVCNKCGAQNLRYQG